MATLKPFTRLISIDSLFLAINETRPSNFVFSGELHDFWEAVLVYSGEAVATGDERVYNLKAGELLFHKPMEFHQISAAGGTSPHLLIISFKASGEGMKLFENRMFSLSLNYLEDFCKVFEKISLAVRLFDEKSDEFSYRANIAATALENFLLRLSAKNPSENDLLSKDASLYKKIVITMNENCEKALSLEEISLLCDMSISNIKRIFALFSDIPPAKYFLNLRIRRAAVLLEDGLSVGKVAKLLDFSSTAYFCTCFLREIGISPSQYKKLKSKE